MLAQGGVTTVANIEAFPELLPHLPVPPLRTWWFLELIDVRSRINEDETLLGALSFFEKHPDWLGGFGLSPHAPYTASVDLYRLARTCGEKYGMLSTTHIAESIEEHEMFSHARGPLYDFLRAWDGTTRIAATARPCPIWSSTASSAPNCIIAHLNYLQDYDYELVANSGASVVHCPKCHTYFGHGPFPMKALLQHGVNVCLGTDSLASNNSLDMRAEMREAQMMHGLGDREVLEMVLLNGARALKQVGKLGQISPGSIADPAAFATLGQEADFSALTRPACRSIPRRTESAAHQREPSQGKLAPAGWRRASRFLKSRAPIARRREYRPPQLLPCATPKRVGVPPHSFIVAPMSLQRARETLELMLGHLGLVFEVEEMEPAGRHVLNIHSREAGRLIGRDGQVLEDLQYLLNRILNRGEEGAANVIVDVEGYRQKEKQDFLGRIRELADQVRQDGKADHPRSDELVRPPRSSIRPSPRTRKSRPKARKAPRA